MNKINREFYTLTPDDPFVLGPVPHNKTIFAVALTAHGFKFAPVLGEILAGLIGAVLQRWIYPFFHFRAGLIRFSWSTDSIMESWLSASVPQITSSNQWVLFELFQMVRFRSGQVVIADNREGTTASGLFATGPAKCRIEIIGAVHENGAGFDAGTDGGGPNRI
jgi:uncharacterized membrane protein YeaQ/YmgE (transglycosylase-associated protein family)